MSFALRTALWQVLCLVGIAAGAGVVLRYANRKTSQSLMRTMGRKGIFVTAWLGTPVHELAHAAMCVVFGHRVTELKLFHPDERTGTLGYCNHAFNKKNPYHVIGNFFIGIAPVISGLTVVYLLMTLLSPNGHWVSQTLTQTSDALAGKPSLVGQLRVVAHATWGLLRVLVDPSSAGSGWYWLSLYAALCVAMHMAPSSADIRGAWVGAAVTGGAFVVLVVLLWLVGVDMAMFARHTSALIAVVLSLLMLVTVLAVGYALVATALLELYQLVSGTR